MTRDVEIPLRHIKYIVALILGLGLGLGLGAWAGSALTARQHVVTYRLPAGCDPQLVMHDLQVMKHAYHLAMTYRPVEAFSYVGKHYAALGRHECGFGLHPSPSPVSPVTVYAPQASR